MQAIILAAELAQSGVKGEHAGLMKVGGRTVLERMLRYLEELHLARIVVVLGHRGESLKQHVESLALQTPLLFVKNADYSRAGSILSLYILSNYLTEDDSLILGSNLIFERSVLTELLQAAEPNVALVTRFQLGQVGETVLQLGGDSAVERVLFRKELDFKICAERESIVQACHIYKFSQDFSERYFLPYLQACMLSDGLELSYEHVLRIICQKDRRILYAKSVEAPGCYELEDEQDLAMAETLFAEDTESYLQRFEGTYGGYWRFPELKDFCYLVNPYYPPQSLLDELAVNLPALLTNYPSGQGVMSRLGAKNTGLKPEEIVVGNGAAELMKAYFEEISSRRVAVIRPTFEEYPARIDGRHDLVEFVPESLQYDLDDLEAFLEKQVVDELILINPDNPSGHYFASGELHLFLDWCLKREIRVLLDESFADFAEEAEMRSEQGYMAANSFLDSEILARFPNLTVIKSVSKAHGLPGLRLGYLAASDGDLIARLKKRLPIWNINAPAEHYLQIAGKYRDSYDEALKRMRADRRAFAAALADYDGVRPLPSEANYLMVELLPRELDGAQIEVRKLVAELAKRQFLIKDLSPKLAKLPQMAGRHFIRLAVKSRADNEAFLAAFEAILTDDLMGLEAEEVPEAAALREILMIDDDVQ